MNPLQNAIHKLEVGGGMKFFRVGLAILALLLFTVGYNWRAFKNMSSIEAMDAAQLGRNMAEGKGYTTDFVRPFSIYLIKKRNEEKLGAPQLGATHDHAMLKTAHPDISNAPVYPLFLAGLMKVIPFRYQIPEKPEPFWFADGRFWRYQPDFLIGIANQILLVGVCVITFFIARKLFDTQVAWMAALLVLGTELLWRFSVSGLPTMLLLLVFMSLAWCVVLIEEQGRAPTWPLYKSILLAAAIGALAALGALTVYSFAWTILPVLLFIGFFSGKPRWILLSTALVVFLAVFTPWIVRNISVAGVPFGTAGYAMFENTGAFPEFKLQRSLNPDLNQPILGAFWAKLMLGFRQTVRDLPTLGGSWLTSFFLVGLLVGFRNPAVKRLRYFILASIVLLGIAQSVARTFVSEEANGITAENLLVLFIPLVIIYGCSLFFLLFEQVQFPIRELRYAGLGLFGALACLPLLLAFMPPKTIPVAWPPYFPPAIQTLGSWLKPSEMAMSDVPWAMSWYGRRQTVWNTLDAKDDFFAINDYMKQVNLLLLTHVTMDSRFLSHWIRAGDKSWGTLVLESIVRGQIPQYFPLRTTQNGWLPDQMVLTDWERWNRAVQK
jgi:4-amino-4-deoxy-L-arabinose transferase-like glycosyltransferase